MKSKVSYIVRSLPFVLAFFVMVGAPSYSFAASPSANAAKAANPSALCKKKCNTPAQRSANKKVCAKCPVKGNSGNTAEKLIAEQRLARHCAQNCRNGLQKSSKACQKCKQQAPSAVAANNSDCPEEDAGAAATPPAQGKSALKGKKMDKAYCAKNCHTKNKWKANKDCKSKGCSAPSK